MSSEYETLLPTDEKPTAGAGFVPGRWWNRVGATILDGFLVGIPILIVAAATGNYSTARFGTPQIASAVLLVVYSVLMLANHAGRTVGKQVANVRVLRDDGAPCDAGRAATREIVKAVFALTGILYVIDALIPLWHPENKALHDFIAGTRVVMADSSTP